MVIELQGQIERITFTNEESGFTVLKIKIYGYHDLVNAVGNFMSPSPGEILIMKGEWIQHPKYGEQFKVNQYTTKVPSSVYGIIKYLGSGLIKGIGPVMASKIVDIFGKDTLGVINNNIEKLHAVEGIGNKRIGMIRSAWEEQKEIREVMLFLQTHGVSSGYAAKIFKQYGDRSISVVKENPYRLATDIFGIGFITADKIAEKLGFPKDSQQRSEAGILYVLNQLADEGHVFYPYDLLIAKSKEILDVDEEIIKNAAHQINLEKRIVIENLTEDPDNIQMAVYLTQFYVCEKGIADKLKKLLSTANNFLQIDADKAIEWVQQYLKIFLAEKQIQAIISVIKKRSVHVITGGPGVGKTTLINALIKIFAKFGLKILLAAPTGRAAKRMTETSGHEAKTIHRLLSFSHQKGGFQKNDKTPLDCHLLIIDESSMIDTVLMYHLLKAVQPGTIFILVGDANQLPSVGPGNVLKDIIDSKVFDVVELNEIFRQAKESKIIVASHKINNGIIPVFEGFNDKNDLYFIEKEDPQEVLKIIIELVKTRVPKRFGFDSIDDIQVISPMHKGIIGAGNLNLSLQEALNPNKEGITRGFKNFRLNDKVMQIKNNYDKEVFNGDIGKITDINPEEQEITIIFDNRNVKYTYSDLDEIVLAYAVSVHKSQGSEYPVIIMPILTQHYILLQKNLIYTAITRGKKLVVLVGTKKALAMGVKNDKVAKRYTHLCQRLLSNG